MTDSVGLSELMTSSFDARFSPDCLSSQHAMHNLNIIEYLMSNLSTLHTTGPLEQKRRRSNCSLGAGIGLAAAYDRGNRYLSKCMAALRSSALFSLANSRRRFLIDGLPATSLNDVHDKTKNRAAPEIEKKILYFF